MLEQITHLVKAQNLRQAVIIDDAYDLPTVRDVSDQGQAFLDCLRDDQDYDVVSRVLDVGDIAEDQLLELLEQDVTIQALYGARDTLPNGTWEALFGNFEQAQTNQRAEIEPIMHVLCEMGLEVTTRGTAVQDNKLTADIVLVDLFFKDTLTAEAAADDAAAKVGPYIPRFDTAQETSPLIVLISSRNAELEHVYAQFRDSAYVPGCRFSFMAKRLFQESPDEALFRLYQLIAHNPSSQQFDQFVRQMGRASEKAKTEFIRILRRFELSDYADLTDLVVRAEGIPLKQYLLELFALSWASLVESSEAFVQALDRLDGLDLTIKNYPPNAFVPSDAVLELYERALYRPPIALGTLSEFGDLGLGDILQSRELVDGIPRLYLVIVQDCDMARGDLPDAAFLINANVAANTEERPKNATTFPYSRDGAKFTVRWNLKRWRMIRSDEFAQFLEKEDLERVQRLRSPWSLACQSQFFQRLARPAEIAAPHDMTAVDIQVLLKDSQQKARVVLDFAGMTMAYVLRGRDEQGSVTRLVMSVDGAEQLRHKLRVAARNDIEYAEDTRGWLDDLLANPAALDALRARLRVKFKKSKLSQEDPLQAIGTAWHPEAHWPSGGQAAQFRMMINIEQIATVDENAVGADS